TCYVHQCSTSVDGITPCLKTNKFKLHAAVEISNPDLYGNYIHSLIMRAIRGEIKAATILAYGQTNSGKTYTINALIQYALEEIFRYQGVDGKTPQGPVTFDAMEMLGKTTRDLTTDDEVFIRESPKGVSIQGVTRTECGDAITLTTLVETIMANRHTVGTHRNTQSSRSHAIYTFSLANKSRIRFLDLAGSENTKDQLFHDQDRVKETSQINFSLMALKDCMRKVAENSAFVPYRNDKLTLLLKNCLNRKGKAKTAPDTCIIVNVSPIQRDVRQTISSIRYAALLCSGTDVKNKGPMAWSKTQMQSWIEMTIGHCPAAFKNLPVKIILTMTKAELTRAVNDREHLGDTLYEAIYTLKQQSKKRAVSSSARPTAEKDAAAKRTAQRARRMKAREAEWVGCDDLPPQA
ncbi:kinesin-like protein, partial [Kipferlia bialata]